jgi:hypothetical protein
MSLFFQVFIFVTLHYICGEQFVEGIAKLGCYLWLFNCVPTIIGRLVRIVQNFMPPFCENEIGSFQGFRIYGVFAHDSIEGIL